MFRAVLLWILTVVAFANADAQTVVIKGKLMAEGAPVPFVNLVLKGTQQGASSDLEGRFTLRVPGPGDYLLRMSAVGFLPKEMAFNVGVHKTIDLGTIALQPDAVDLGEVVVTGTMREVSRSDSPVPVEVITPALFRKNPSPALFDAVGMVNGVRPQINCSVCNTGDIHINGMEGP
ncbi:MAG: carboxypeptidase-like regulatory domain-containing protein, partial [Flavobacteriales bacterium]|nr:carboxypeptidase-like regulatory domain-containing protein [Flavobacteriales bacterium]